MTLDFHLGNYVDIFYSFMNKGEKYVPLSAQSRFMSLYAVVHKLSDAVAKCLAKQSSDLSAERKNAAQRKCGDAIADPDVIASFSEEESFVYSYRWIMTRFSLGGLLNSEITMVQWRDEKMKKLADRSLAQGC